MSNDILLDIIDLRTYVHMRAGTVRAVDGASFSIRRGEALGLVGESGSGKSMTCQAIMRVELRPAAVIEGGQILLDGENLLDKSPEEMQQVRGRRIGMILQDPLNSLNPVLTIGNQLIEALRLSQPGAGKADLRRQAQAALERVGITNAASRLDSYPFEFSGGMCQRVTAAMAVARHPALLIADEPTTALDVTTQARFLGLLDQLRREEGMSLLLVTHDLGIVAETCDRVAVMYAGRVVETGITAQILREPRHPYTRALMFAVPHLDGPRTRRLYQIPGEPPSVRAPTVGCRFAPRCDQAADICRAKYPPTVYYVNGDTVACWLHVPDAAAHADATNTVTLQRLNSVATGVEGCGK